MVRLIVNIIFIIILTSNAFSQVEMSWNKNPEHNIDHYKLIVYYDNDSVIYLCKDTVVNVFIPKSNRDDSVSCVVYAVNDKGLISGPSIKIGFIPAVLEMDYVDDSNHRIDIEDLREFLRLYRRYYAKTIWKYVEQ